MHPFRSAGVVGTARKEGDTGNRGRPVAGEGSGLNVTLGGGADRAPPPLERLHLYLHIDKEFGMDDD